VQTGRSLPQAQPVNTASANCERLQHL